MSTDVLDSPAELLAGLVLPPGSASHLLLISAPSGAGKTHWCRQLVEHACRLSLSVAGLLSLPVFSASRKTRIDLHDLHTGVQRPLAVRRVGQGGGVVWGAWDFDPAVIRWGNDCLRAVRVCQLLVIDELGPLEFEQDDGFTAAFPLLDSACYRLACVTLRPSLLPAAQQRWVSARLLSLPQRPEAA